MHTQVLTQVLPLLSPDSFLKRQAPAPPCPSLPSQNITVQAFQTYITTATKAPSYLEFLLPDLRGANGSTFFCNLTMYSHPHAPVTTVQLAAFIPCTEIPTTLGARPSGLAVEFMYYNGRLTITESLLCNRWVPRFCDR